jgi:microsomal dipeptidase-like Zn-dependent dipeptidase
MAPLVARRAFLALVALVALVGAGVAALPGIVESRMNPVLRPGPYAVSARALALHRRLVVADLHADTLLWGRDLLARGTRGHVDVPRLLEGGVSLQAFTVVTKMPWGTNIRQNTGDTDQITLLLIARARPPRTWRSLRERALDQAAAFERAAARSGGRLVPLLTKADLEALLERRAKGEAVVGGWLGLEGAHALEGRKEAVDALADAGFRMIGLTHFFDNEVAGSAHGVLKGGLTAVGREAVRRMEARGVLVDLAHASPRAVDDVLALARRPVVVSHGGVRGTCDNARNLSDSQLRGVAAAGGVVGIGFWETATCGTDVRAIARAVAHAVRVAGRDHVALGSDFDGAVATPFDATGVPLVTEALLGAGLDEETVGQVMGGNVVRLLRATLPVEAPRRSTP